METLIMRGKPVADAYRETIMQRVANALGKGRKVTLAIIVVGDGWQLLLLAMTRLRTFTKTV